MNIKDLSDGELIALWHMTNASIVAFRAGIRDGGDTSVIHQLHELHSNTLWSRVNSEIVKRGIDAWACTKTVTTIKEITQ